MAAAAGLRVVVPCRHSQAVEPALARSFSLSLPAARARSRLRSAHQALQSCVLIAQLTQLAQLQQPQVRVALLPDVKRRFADPPSAGTTSLTAWPACACSGYVGFFLGVSGLLHRYSGCEEGRNQLQHALVAVLFRQSSLSVCRDRPGQKTTRQTAHLDNYPRQVKIVRERHAFEGMALDVLGWCHRHGKLHLTLVLPDGTKSLVPAAWTDLHAAEEAHLPRRQKAQAASLASRSDLLQARTIVNALLQRLDGANTAHPPVSQECSHAAAELSRTTPSGERRARVAQPRRGATRPSARETRSTNRKRNRPHTRRARR